MTKPPQDKDWKEKEREAWQEWLDTNTTQENVRNIADFWVHRLESHRQEAVGGYRKAILEYCERLVEDWEKSLESVHDPVARQYVEGALGTALNVRKEITNLLFRLSDTTL